jgi:hypothetical protein
MGFRGKELWKTASTVSQEHIVLGIQKRNKKERILKYIRLKKWR